MKCKACDYEGPAEVGDYGKDPDFVWVTKHYRCPKCKSEKVLYIDTGDHLEAFIKFGEECSGPENPHEPVKKQLSLSPPNQFGMATYSICCPYCQWGQAGSLSKEDYERAKAVMVTIPA